VYSTEDRANSSKVIRLLAGLPRSSDSILDRDKNNNQTPWPESASELYRPSDRRLSAKLIPTFADRGVQRSQRGGSPAAVISVFLTGVATLSFE
jgi:hypothetical protein